MLKTWHQRTAEWTAGGEKQDEERYNQFSELPRQDEQRRFEVLFAVCLKEVLRTARAQELV